MEIWDATPKDMPSVHLVDLVYELLDAHQDTMQLAQDGGGAFGWEAHLDYLRRLQRVGREALARTLTTDQPAGRLTAGAPNAPAPGSASPRRWD
jgi:hypothetical protein